MRGPTAFRHLPNQLALGIILIAIVAGLHLNQDPERLAAVGGKGGFVSEIAFPGLVDPIDFAFAPDGRIFVIAKSGVVRIIKDGALLDTPFTTLPVNDFAHRGLQSIALDPLFETNGYVYLYYTYENNPDDYQGSKTGQLVRVAANGDIAAPASEVVLLGTEVGNPSQPSCQDFPVGANCIPADGASHVGGGLAFAPDGALLLATGDGAYFPAGAPEELLLRPQDLDDLAGKILRINPADGSALPDNPFFTGDSNANRSKVWAYGFRNPFRMAIDPATSLLIAGDVGSSFWEELNEITPGANYGWPCYEGTSEHPIQNTLNVCRTLYSSGGIVTHPLYSYAGPNAAVIAGAFYHGSNYPSEFEGAFIFSDYVATAVNVLPAGSNSGTLLPDQVGQLLEAGDAPVDFGIGPNGDIYYLTIYFTGSGLSGDLRRIRFLEGNRSPVAQASAQPLGGLSPLSVQFNSESSSDPDSDTITYAWDFDDGESSTEANPIHVYQSNGAYHPQLTVSDPAGAASSMTLSILVGNQPPVVTISAPLPNSPYQGGQTVPFAGSAFDPETGNLADPQLQWAVQLHHCYVAVLACHAHPFLIETGSSGELIAPLQTAGDEFIYLELQLTATDSAGLSQTASAFIGPDSDADGMLDSDEILVYLTDYLNPDTDGDTCYDGREAGPNQRLGGRRDPTDPWDYFNPTGDRQNRVDDILAVVAQYYHEDNDVTPGFAPFTPGYMQATDRTAAGPDFWDSGPPNGQQRVDDILNIVKQYFHDCA